jgi:hypothetical protein
MTAFGGRAAVRAAVTSYLTNYANPPIPYLGTVYPARTYVNEQDYTEDMTGQAVAASQGGSAAVATVNLPQSTRTREAEVGRAAVNDLNVHKVALEVFFASTGGNPVTAQQDHDTVMDAITVAIRADGTLGGQVWSAAEYQGGVEVLQAMPYTDDEGMVVFIPSVVRFEVWEWIAGQAPL